MQAAFRGRKHIPTQNMLATVDFDLKFTYVLAGWEGSAHDATILADALERKDGLVVPEGKFYLVDAGYACRPGFLPPYRGTRYHLNEYGDEVIPLESTWEPNSSASTAIGVDIAENHVWASVRDDMANLMWDMAAEHAMLDLVVADPAVQAGAQPVAMPDGAPAAAATGQQGRQSMRWTNAMSSFVLRRFCQLIATGVRTDKGFKEVHLNQVAKDLHDFSGTEVTETQVYNHLQNYQQMQVIFANGLATGKFAMGSSKPLGSPSDFIESSLKTEDVKVMNGEPSKQDVAGGSGSGVGSKRKRCINDEDLNVMSGMTAAVREVADAICETKVEPSHPDLYGAVMFMAGFTEEALIVAYSHLLDNRAHANTLYSG
ncbi:hypothetical protein QOZ80_1AG0041210 [Eleusine coracana subsp. coracana]|nr:hypothetical protein QOZ80_1AG0041210 [Eleusine coracana subsp. coracana]